MDVDLNAGANNECGAIIWDDNIINDMLIPYYARVNNDLDFSNNAYHNEETKTKLTHCGDADDGNYLIAPDDIRKLWHCNHDGGGRPIYLRKLGKSPTIPDQAIARASIFRSARALKESIVNSGEEIIIDSINIKELNQLIDNCKECNRLSRLQGVDSFTVA